MRAKVWPGRGGWVLWLLTLGSAAGVAAQDPQRPAEDLRCLSDRPGQCLAVPVPADEPHGAVCATCHDLFMQESLADAAATCTSSRCHGDVAALSGFHRAHAPGLLANCLRCHDPHDARIPGGGHDCLACHSEGGAPVPPRRWERPANTAVPAPPEPTLWQQRYRGQVCAACHTPAGTGGGN